MSVNKKKNIKLVFTSLVEQVFGQYFSKPLIIGSPSVGSFSINCTIQ
jgi:hypothetical protein